MNEVRYERCWEGPCCIDGGKGYREPETCEFKPKLIESPPRPNWDEYFLAGCQWAASRADCRRAQHACIIVKSHRVVSIGYNGSPSGGPSCLAGECPRGLLTQAECASLSGDYSNCIALHAEQNAIAYANRDDTKGATAYLTGKPCPMCEKLLIAAGIERIVY